ncbi:MAG: helix-turn-helix transcriptional regulator [Myxococcota bacterium]
MRRIGLRETLHGTRDGQLAVDASLAERYGLSERESACAALVKRGCSAHEIADRLEISPSTAEKHLVALRRKLGVSSTLEAAVALLGEESESTARIPDAFGVVLPVSSSDKAASDTAIDSSSTDLVARLRTAATLDEMLELVRADLEDDGVVALFWYFLPLSAASFRKGDVLQRHSAPASLIDALQADSGATQARTAARLFAEPDRPVVVRLDRDDDAVSSSSRRPRRRASVGVGIPSARRSEPATSCSRPSTDRARGDGGPGCGAVGSRAPASRAAPADAAWPTRWERLRGVRDSRCVNATRPR